VHNNFYFLRQLTTILQSRLKGSVASECFSQSKDELVLRFETEAAPFFIRASLLPTLSCLSFPENFQRARKNSVDLFSEIIGTRVSEVRQFKNERSFAITFSDDYHLLFKMHGNRTNLVLFHKGMARVLFRNNLTADLALNLERLDREIDWSFQYFQRHAHNLKPVYFTFGKVVWHYLEEKNFSLKDTAHKWKSIQDVLQQLENPAYYITVLDEKPTLSLLPIGDVMHILDDPIDAANEYFHNFTHLYAFSKEKISLLNELRSRVAAAQNYIEKNSVRLGELQRDSHYRIWADLIMANLHRIKPGADVAMVENFYDKNRRVEIKLKKDLPAQKTAEIFYKKAKNQHIETERLGQSIRQKQEDLQTIRKKIEDVESATDLKSLRNLKSAIDPKGGREAETAQLPYHEFFFRDYRIWVGKNAQGNDTLTLKYGYKDDLWLHAKDVSGSHVLIKHRAGKVFPKDVIEYAASLAAFNSKRKNESLCPVIVTPKKFVRKRKGDPPGMVVVEREEVIMVVPAKIS
jgi:predicted ribosome quality control (RQC) complex YloA/Tae2 family protein